MLNVQSGRDARQRSMSHLGSRASGWRKHRTTGAEATAAAAHAAGLISAVAASLSAHAAGLVPCGSSHGTGVMLCEARTGTTTCIPQALRANAVFTLRTTVIGGWKLYKYDSWWGTRQQPTLSALSKPRGQRTSSSMMFHNDALETEATHRRSRSHHRRPGRPCRTGHRHSRRIGRLQMHNDMAMAMSFMSALACPQFKREPQRDCRSVGSVVSPAILHRCMRECTCSGRVSHEL